MLVEYYTIKHLYTGLLSKKVSLLRIIFICCFGVVSMERFLIKSTFIKKKEYPTFIFNLQLLIDYLT